MGGGEDGNRDRELIERVLAGDAAAAEEFHARFHPVVCGVLVRMVGPGDAEDVAQEVFLRAIAHLARFRHDASLGWWMARIASHCGSRWLRSRRRGERFLLRLPPPAQPETPEERVLAGEEQDHARRALARLPGPDRRILELREVLGLPYTEIQIRLEIEHMGTVRSRLHKARESLRRAWRVLTR